MPLRPSALIYQLVMITESITTKVKIRANFTGSINFQITANATDDNPTFDTVSLTSGEWTEHTMSVPGRYFGLLIVGSGAVLSADGNTPAIDVKRIN